MARVLELEPDFLDAGHTHEHDDAITAISLHSTQPMDPDRFQGWFSTLLRTKGQDILRSKGIIDLDGEDQRDVIQGVHMLMDGNQLRPWPEGKLRETKLVFIGRNLNSMGLREEFKACKAA